jgi:hypothetical protein
MTRRPTLSEMIWPDGPEDAYLAIEWAAGVATQVLDWTWRAFDSLKIAHLTKVDFSRHPEQVERDLTRHHFIEIQLLFASETRGFASFVPAPEWPEMETRSSPTAKPPAYDFAFVSVDNRRWAWPIEAKVVTSPGALGEYMKDVSAKFAAGVGAPLVGEGAMIAYLVSCDGDAVLDGIASRLGQILAVVPEFAGRVHKASFHGRTSAPPIRLHHLMMACN